jgi:hypothetical protein
MVMSPVALIAERRQIDAIIGADPVEVVFMRSEKIPTPDNSFYWGPRTPVYKPGTQNDPQRVAMVPFKRRLTDMLINTEIGDVELVPYTLVCRHDADVKRGDEFELDGEQYKVKWIDIKKQVRITAGVDYQGGEPR